MKNFDADAFNERLHKESDRACAVLGAALLDAQLEALFDEKLRRFNKKLLTYPGPLSTLAARIDVATALGWISDDVCTNLNTIKSVRNAFAHNFDHALSFEEESIASKCRNLSVAQAFIDGFDLAAVAPDQNLAPEVIRSIQDVYRCSARARFQLAIDFIRQYLDDTSTDILEEVRALSANTRIRFSAKGTLTDAARTPDLEPPA